MRTEDGKIHDMILINEYEGSEQWYCPYCGRRLLVSWGPQFEKTILKVGDDSAIHRGDINNLQTDSMDSMLLSPLQSQEQPEESGEDLWLIPWMNWMEEAGFDQLWKNDNDPVV